MSVLPQLIYQLTAQPELLTTVLQDPAILWHQFHLTQVEIQTLLEVFSHQTHLNILLSAEQLYQIIDLPLDGTWIPQP